MALFPSMAQPAFTVTSDASGSWGCGTWSGPRWFQFKWPPEAQAHHISFKELFAGLLSCAIWGRLWRECRVQWLYDNQAAIYAVRGRSCRDQKMMHLVRCLFFLEAWFEFELVAAHLPGRDNLLADDLSRNRLSTFLSKAQSPDSAPATIQPALPGLLLSHEGWTSQTWTQHFSTIVTAV